MFTPDTVVTLFLIAAFLFGYLLRSVNEKKH